VAEGEAGFHKESVLDEASLNTNRKLENQSSPLAQPPKCPLCGSERLYKDGLRYFNDGSDIQRWLCRDCGYRFSERKPLQENPNWQINTASAYLSNRQVCELLTEESKNLAEVARQETAPREGTLSQQKIIDFMWYMKKKGLAESTVRGRVKLIKRLAKLGANVYDPENVKDVIAKQSWCPGRKDFACEAYNTFVEMNGGTWVRPIYKPVDQEIWIPQPIEVKQLIAGCSQRMACFLQTLSETAMRPGELWTSKWDAYDQPTRTFRVTPEKGSNSGTFKLTKQLAAMLDALPHKYGDRIFSKPDMDLDHHRGNFIGQRKRIAQKLQNPRILRINFKSLRHFSGTMVAWKTDSPFEVKDHLRHKSFKNTMRYIHLAQLLFKHEHEYDARVAHNVKEACALIEKGWKYHTGEYDDGGKIFARPKDPQDSEE
jgi:integrase